MPVSSETYCSWMPRGTRVWFGWFSGQPPVTMYSDTSAATFSGDCSWK
jgi:hypothetical protein